MTDKEDLIHQLQNEVIFLQELPDEFNLEHYSFKIKGDLSISRSC